MTLLWTSFILLGGTVLFLLFVRQIKRTPVLVTVFAGVVSTISWEVPRLPAIFNIGGNNVFPIDIFITALFIVALSQLGRLRLNMGWFGWAWLLFGLALFGSLIKGIGPYGLGQSVNEFRGFFYVYVVMTWAMTLNWNAQLVLINIKWTSFIVGWFLILVGSYHIYVHGLGTVSDFVVDDSGMIQTSRPLTSGQAYMLGICLVICVFIWKKEKNRSFAVAALAFSVGLILSQQRSVWSVVVAALLVILIFGRSASKRSIIFGGVLAFIGLAIIISTNSMNSVTSQIFEAADNLQTYDARVSSWQDLISESFSQGPVTVYFGAPMGAGYGRFESVGRWVDFAPHNWYITVYLRVGLVGLSFMLLFILGLLISAIRNKSNMAVLSLIVMIIIYGWNYSWIWYVGIITGWALVQANTKKYQTISSSLDLS